MCLVKKLALIWLVKRFEQQINHWTFRFLSVEGRLVLLKSVVCAGGTTGVLVLPDENPTIHLVTYEEIDVQLLMGWLC